MAKTKSNHVFASKANGGWTVKKAGTTRSSKKFKPKDEAVRYGRKVSKSEKSELYIHKKDDTIQNRNS